MLVLKVKVISLPYVFPGFVCVVLYLAKISGERLQDHWSSGIIYFYFNSLQIKWTFREGLCRE